MINDQILSASESQVMELLFQDEKYWEEVFDVEEEPETIQETEEDFETWYWNSWYAYQEFLEDVFNESIAIWEKKRNNRKFRNNSNFKNKLRDKGHLYSKIHLLGGKINERFVELKIFDVQRVEPIHRMYGSDHDIQDNAKEFFFGKPVNKNVLLVNGQRIGYRWHKLGSRCWKKIWKKRDKGQKDTLVKKEIADEIRCFEPIVQNVDFNPEDYFFGPDDELCF